MLSRLLFQKASGALSLFQALQLAQAVTELSGYSSGPGMFDQACKGLGLDNLDVSTGGPTVGASKYVSDRMSVGVKAGANPADTAATVDYDITRRVKVRGEAGSDGRSASARSGNGERSDQWNRMPARPLLIHPDQALRRPALPVRTFDAATREIAGDVLDTLRAVSALGLTAPHIGEAVRIVVIRLQPDLPAVTYLNPEIVWASPERVTQEEGSVSMPGITERVGRPARIRLRYAALDGTPIECEADGFLAACLQHEIDQLDGVFWIERLTRLRRERALKRYAKLRCLAQGATPPVP